MQWSRQVHRSAALVLHGRVLMAAVVVSSLHQGCFQHGLEPQKGEDTAGSLQPSTGLACASQQTPSVVDIRWPGLPAKWHLGGWQVAPASRGQGLTISSDSPPSRVHGDFIVTKAADQPHCDSYQAIAPVMQREARALDEMSMDAVTQLAP